MDSSSIPERFLCPIGQTLMQNPVITSAGQTYDRANIENWLRTNKTDPVTREPITSTLFPNFHMKSEIDEFLRSQQQQQNSQRTFQTTESSLTKRVVYLPTQRRLSTVFIGNPGVGKSTVLNSILGKVAFRAGVSLGKGLTTILQEESDQNGNFFIDTPGLSDPEMRKQAAVEIKKALTKGGNFKIIFTFTLESGRIRPDDQTTMALVLEAAPMIGSSYSILINKASKKVLQEWENINKRRDFLKVLHQGFPGTTNVYLNPLDLCLEDESDVLVPLSSGLKQFLEKAPQLEIIKQNVRDIQIQDFERLKKEMSEKVNALQERLALQEKLAQEQAQEMQRRELAYQAQKKALEEQRKGKKNNDTGRKRNEGGFWRFKHFKRSWTTGTWLWAWLVVLSCGFLISVI